jgi:uncharacterized membrane protein YhaH (DUF805 family)
VIQHISIKFSDFYSLRGRIGRVVFFIGLLVTSSSIAAIHFLSRTYLLGLNNLITYLGFNTILQLLGLSLATPFYVKRFHDLNSSGYWVIFYWAVFPFSFHVSYSIELLTGYLISPFNEFIFFIVILGLLMLLVQLFKSGNPEENQWGNQRMQSDAAEPNR